MSYNSYDSINSQIKQAITPPGGLFGINNQTSSMDPLSLGLGVGSAVIGGIGSLFGSSSSNKTNLRIARETNEMNYKIWQEQKKHNVDMFNRENQAAIDMWNMQNEYNDPSAVAARLSAAGINPATMAGNSGLGMSSSAPDVGSAQPASAPQMQMPAPIDSPLIAGVQGAFNSLSALSTSLQQISQADQTNTLTPIVATGQALDNVGKDLSNKHQRIYNSYAPHLYHAQWDSLFTSTGIARNRQWLELDILREQRDYLDGMNVGISLDNESKRIINGYLDGNQRAQMFATLANGYQAYRNGLMSAKQYDHFMDLQLRPAWSLDWQQRTAGNLNNENSQRLMYGFNTFQSQTELEGLKAEDEKSSYLKFRNNIKRSFSLYYLNKELQEANENMKLGFKNELYKGVYNKADAKALTNPYRLNRFARTSLGGLSGSIDMKVGAKVLGIGVDYGYSVSGSAQPFDYNNP